jgi:hypothetical protein
MFVPQPLRKTAHKTTLAKISATRITRSVVFPPLPCDHGTLITVRLEETRHAMIRRKIEPPRGVLKTAGAHPRHFRHERYHPSRDLESYVEHYWVVEWDLRGQAPVRAETLPHPSVHMIFEQAGRSQIRGAARAKFSRVLNDKGGVFAVKFTPAGFIPSRMFQCRDSRTPR